MESGMSEAEAEKQATKDSIHQLLYDITGGMLSGTVMGGDQMLRTAFTAGLRMQKRRGR